MNTWNLHIKLFIEAKKLYKAEKITNEFVENHFDGNVSIKEIEPYHKGGYVSLIESTVSTGQWSEAIHQVVLKAQCIASSWVLSGDAKFNLDLWSSDISIPGISDIHFQMFEDEKRIKPYIQVHYDPELKMILVQVLDYELFDYIEDYLIEEYGIDYKYVRLDPIVPESKKPQVTIMYFDENKFSLEQIKQALSKLDPQELERIYRLNN